jgi:hypothetical protein
MLKEQIRKFLLKSGQVKTENPEIYKEFTKTIEKVVI